MRSKVVCFGRILRSCEISIVIGRVLTEILTGTQKYLLQNAWYHEKYELWRQMYEKQSASHTFASKQSCSARRAALHRRSSRLKS